jgi:hypothetical protein
MSNELYTVTDWEVTCDQLAHPEMNYAAFVQWVDVELNKFTRMIMGLNSEFISPQDVSGVGGISCRFHNINGYPAIRQMTQYNPNSKTWFVWFDCRVLQRAPETIKADGDMSAKLEPQDTSPATVDPTPPLTEEDVRAEFEAKFKVH